MEYDDDSTNFGNVAGDLFGARVDGSGNSFTKNIFMPVIITNLPSREIESEVRKLVNAFSQGDSKKAVESLTKITQDPNIQRQVEERRIEQDNISPNTIMPLPDRNKGTIKIKEEVPYALLPKQVLATSPSSSGSVASGWSQPKYNHITINIDRNSVPEVDIDLLLLKAFANLENHYKKQANEIKRRTNSTGGPQTQQEALELQNARSKLGIMSSTIKERGRRYASEILEINSIRDGMDGIKYYTSDGNPVYE